MDKEKLERLEEIRSRYEARLDGSSSSGNWGHVGRPGQRGGSAPGGGGAFRMTYKKARKGGEEYTSHAKERKKAQVKISKARTKLAEAKKSGNEKKITQAEKRLDRANKHASKINMNQKSADETKRGKKGYEVVNNYDPKASKNILNDPARGKRATETRAVGVKGTKEAIEKAFPNRIKDGQKTVNGKRGGKVKQSKKPQEEEEWIPLF